MGKPIVPGLIPSKSKISPKLLQRMQTATTLAAGVKIPFRKRVRVFTEDRRVEGTIILVVLVYFIVICLDFTIPSIMYTVEADFTDEYQKFIINWTRAFWAIDLVFLTIFFIEIALRIYAWGWEYLRDMLNFIDLIIVWCSLILLFVTMEYTIFGEGGGGLENTRGILRVFRLVRILRVVVILNKIKRSRENAQIMRKKAKYKRQGSPVERVVEILQRFRRKAESSVERENLAFIIDAIISDQLYTVTASETAGMTTEMSAFLLEGGAQTKKQAKVAGGPVGKVFTRSGTMTLSPSGRRAMSRKGSKLRGSHNNDEEIVATEESTNGTPLSPRPPAMSLMEHRLQSQNILVSEGELKRNDRRGSAVGLRATELAWVDALQSSPDVKEALVYVDQWEWSVFDLEKVSQGNTILLLALTMVNKFELETSLPINMENLARLMMKLDAAYNLDQDRPPFHNSMHGADCVQSTSYFLLQENVSRHLTPLDIYCMILGAALHDFGHLGFNNAFLVASKHDTAILYNDLSVLENFHISQAWKLMLTDELNPFAGFSDEQYQEARQTMVYAVLGTDMKFHFDHLTKFKTRLSAGAFEDPDRKDVRLLLAMCLHSADVSNPAKKWELSSEWSCRVMEEFFQQGEEEARVGLPVSPFMDRSKTDIASCQSGFISILIKPFFDEWTQFLGDDQRHIFSNIEDNIKKWTEGGEAALEQALNDAKRFERLKKGNA